MAEELAPAAYAAAVSKVAVAQICRTAGYRAAEPSALRALSDIAVRHIAAVASSAAAAANGRGRTDCNLLDLIRAFEDLGLLRGFAGAAAPAAPLLHSGAMRELMAFMASVDEIPFPRALPPQPSPPPAAPASFALAGREPPLPHVPRWLPCFPFPEEKPVIEAENRRTSVVNEAAVRRTSVVDGGKRLAVVVGRGKVRFKLGFGKEKIPPSSRPPHSSGDHRNYHLRRRTDDPTIITWSSTIARHARANNLPAAAAALATMLAASALPNDITLLTLLSACADFPSSPAALPLSRLLHTFTLKLGYSPNIPIATALLDAYAKSNLPHLARQVFDTMPHKNSVTYNTMIAGYMRAGDITHAVSVFQSMPHRDRVSWTALLNGCANNGQTEDALYHFRDMLTENVAPDYVTIITVIAACTDLGALGLGLWVHCYAMRQGFGRNVRIGNSLIDMYARCGRPEFAFQVFDGMRERTRVTWNSMVMGFAINGCSSEALELFSSMRVAGIEPDGVSFTGALTACTHAGLVEEGLGYYNVMRKECRIRPRIEHYGCVVDLLGRAGRLEDAMRVVESLSMEPNEVVLGSLLAACRMHGDVGMAERVMRIVVELEPDCDSNYVLLSNVYAAIGEWGEVGEVRNRMKARGIRKNPGFSAVEVDCAFHEFVAGDRAHPQKDDVYDMLELLRFEMKLYGYDPLISPDGD